MADIFLFLAVAGGPILLAGVIVYAVIRNRRLTPGERQRRSQAVHELYKGENPS